MKISLSVSLLVFLFSVQLCKSQNIYFKNPSPDSVRLFSDSLKRIQILNADSNSLLEHQMAYLLRFYPNMPFKNIRIKYKKGSYLVKTQVRISSIFKSPEQRIYKIFLTTGTHSALDSVMLNNLSFNSQLGMMANQLSLIEDLSAGGFFNFLSWYTKLVSHGGQKKLYHEAELKTLELGLGYQLLAYNTEFLERLKIDNWQNTRGYNYYMKHYRNHFMKPALIQNFIGDLPVYMSHPYR